MNKEHHYRLEVEWTGNPGEGTVHYSKYKRDHVIRIENKPDILGSSDTAFRGDATRHNPEDMLLASLSTCHMLWYLHLCADAGIVVMSYIDYPEGTMLEDANGGHFTEVVLKPVVKITDGSLEEKANALHDEAHKKCFIANSVNFPVRHLPVCHQA